MKKTPGQWSPNYEIMSVLGPERPHLQAGKHGLPKDLVNRTIVAHVRGLDRAEQAANVDAISAVPDLCDAVRVLLKALGGLVMSLPGDDEVADYAEILTQCEEADNVARAAMFKAGEPLASETEDAKP